MNGQKKKNNGIYLVYMSTRVARKLMVKPVKAGLVLEVSGSPTMYAPWVTCKTAMKFELKANARLKL